MALIRCNDSSCPVISLVFFVLELELDGEIKIILGGQSNNPVILCPLPRSVDSECAEATKHFKSLPETHVRRVAVELLRQPTDTEPEHSVCGNTRPKMHYQIKSHANPHHIDFRNG